MCTDPVFLLWNFVVCCVQGLLHFLCWQQMEEIWREMRWIMDVLQHARYKQPSCGVPLSGFLSEAGGPAKEKTQSSSSHLDYLPSPVPSPETSRKLNSGKDLAVLGGLGGCSWSVGQGSSTLELTGWSWAGQDRSHSAVPWRAQLRCATRG